MTVFVFGDQGGGGKLERNEFLGFIFQICDLLLEDGFDFHTEETEYFSIREERLPRQARVLVVRLRVTGSVKSSLM